MTDGYPVLDGNGKVLAAKRVPDGAVDHGQITRDMREALARHDAVLNAVAASPLMADEAAPVTGGMWNRLIGFFRNGRG